MCYLEKFRNKTSIKIKKQEVGSALKASWNLLFTMDGARGRTRTGTGITPQGILSPLRLPISPPGLVSCNILAGFAL